MAKGKYSVREKRAYWVGYGHGLSYPSGKSASYIDSLSEKERKSYLNGFKKTDKIASSNSNAFANRVKNK